MSLQGTVPFLDAIPIDILMGISWRLEAELLNRPHSEDYTNGSLFALLSGSEALSCEDGNIVINP